MHCSHRCACGSLSVAVCDSIILFGEKSPRHILWITTSGKYQFSSIQSHFGARWKCRIHLISTPANVSGIMNSLCDVWSLWWAYYLYFFLIVLFFSLTVYILSSLDNISLFYLQLRSSQSYCTDTQCDDIPGLQGPPQNEGNMPFFIICWVVLAMALFFLRPGSIRPQGDRKHNDNQVL